MTTREYGRYRMAMRFHPPSDIRVLHPAVHARVPFERATIIPLVLWFPDWKSRLVAAILRQDPGDFVDVGANIGQTLVDYLFAGSNTNYWGIEPNLDCLPILHRIVESNDLRRCVLLNVGLSDAGGSGLLHLAPDFLTDTRATLRSDLRPERSYRFSQIELTTFDQLRNRYPMPHISLIKIDVEGAELQVLRGMAATLANDRPPILCEVLLRDRAADKERYGRWAGDLMAFLSESEYIVHRVEKTVRRPRVAAEPTTAFPLAAWTWYRANQCDYLFLPAEHAARYRNLLDAS